MENTSAHLPQKSKPNSVAISNSPIAHERDSLAHWLTTIKGEPTLSDLAQVEKTFTPCLTLAKTIDRVDLVEAKIRLALQVKKAAAKLDYDLREEVCNAFADYVFDSQTGCNIAHVYVFLQKFPVEQGLDYGKLPVRALTKGLEEFMNKVREAERAHKLAVRKAEEAARHAAYEAKLAADPAFAAAEAARIDALVKGIEAQIPTEPHAVPGSELRGLGSQLRDALAQINQHFRNPNTQNPV